MSITRPLTRPLVGPLTSPLTQAWAGGGGGFSLSSLFADGERLGIWLADDFSRLWQDTAGTTPITATGQTVKRIDDQSGNGTHVTNATGWVLQQDANGCYYLDMDASSAFTASFSPLTAYPLTLVAAAKSDVTTSYGGYISVRQSDAYYKLLYNYNSVAWAVNDRGGAQNAASETVGTNATPHVGIGDFRAATANIILDGVDTNAGAANANAFGSHNEVYIGKTFVSGPYSDGRFYGAMAINRTLTLTERKRVEHLMQGLCGRPYDVLNGYIAEGDSITQGYSATGQVGYAQQFVTTAPRLPVKFIQAVSGNTMSDVEGRLATTAANCVAIIAQGMQPIVSLMIGMNDKAEVTADPAAYFARITAYAATVRGYGAKFVACTVSASNPATYATFEATGRPGLNALIRAGSANFDAVCDFAADSRINVWGATYYADGQHPNDAGHAIMRDILTAAIAPIRRSSV